MTTRVVAKVFRLGVGGKFRVLFHGLQRAQILLSSRAAKSALGAFWSRAKAFRTSPCCWYAAGALLLTIASSGLRHAGKGAVRLTTPNANKPETSRRTGANDASSEASGSKSRI